MSQFTRDEMKRNIEAKTGMALTDQPIEAQLRDAKNKRDSVPVQRARAVPTTPAEARSALAAAEALRSKRIADQKAAHPTPANPWEAAKGPQTWKPKYAKLLDKGAADFEARQKAEAEAAERRAKLEASQDYIDATGSAGRLVEHARNHPVLAQRALDAQACLASTADHSAYWQTAREILDGLHADISARRKALDMTTAQTTMESASLSAGAVKVAEEIGKVPQGDASKGEDTRQAE